MGLSETIVFYIMIGLGVAVATFLGEETQSLRETGFRLTTATLFWPLYLPILLKRREQPRPQPAGQMQEPPDEMATAIAQVEAELDAALSSLDGWAEDVLAREQNRIQELRGAWSAQARRIREMDRLLAQDEWSRSQESVPAATQMGQRDADSPDHPQRSRAGEAAAEFALDRDANGRRRQSEQARQKNIDRLRRVRWQAREDLMGTLAWVRELVSMIQLAKFTGAPASRAEELVSQIAAAVEGVSAVTWQEEATPALHTDGS